MSDFCFAKKNFGNEILPRSVIDAQPNMAVDTHVFRVSKRIGLVATTANTPYAVEMELIKNIPEVVVHKAHHWLILHGRYICIARKPKCEICGIKEACIFYKKIIKLRTK